MGGKAAGCGGGGDLQLGGQHGGHQSWGTNWSDNLKKGGLLAHNDKTGTNYIILDNFRVNKNKMFLN